MRTVYPPHHWLLDILLRERKEKNEQKFLLTNNTRNQIELNNSFYNVTRKELRLLSGLGDQEFICACQAQITDFDKDYWLPHLEECVPQKASFADTVCDH
ncbi:hypothetical protein AVEN_30454-1 [Araneus ventricosus]|uniref:Uncharacterized protein n=1 Tax=Araneus ventricosus TaxID=182803 RepID=A0A4Y2TNA1_ARAVE|nr:hypothetical protein AVEN_30454-1 [Araneus ventricosus]